MKIKKTDKGGGGGKCSVSFTISWESLTERALVNKNGHAPKFHYIQIPVCSSQCNPLYDFIFKVPEN